MQSVKEKIKENNERKGLWLLFSLFDKNYAVKVTKTPPYHVSNVIELLGLEETAEEEGANVDLEAHKPHSAVIKTSTRATYFLPVIGLVDLTEMKPGDLIGVNKVREARQKKSSATLPPRFQNSYFVPEKLPPTHDLRIEAIAHHADPLAQDERSVSAIGRSPSLRHFALCSKDVNLEEPTIFNGAKCEAVCVEAGARASASRLRSGNGRFASGFNRSQSRGFLWTRSSICRPRRKRRNTRGRVCARASC